MERLKHIILILIVFVLSAYQADAQETIYSQDFTAADGTTSGTTPGQVWKVDTSGGCGLTYDFGIINNAFNVKRARGFDCGCNGADQGNNKNIVEFGPIDISNHCDIEVSLNTTATANMECGDNGVTVPFYCDISVIGHDMLWVEVIIDGTAQTMLYYCGPFLTVNNTMAGLSGSSMTIRITSGNQANNEIYTIDDILVEGIPAGGGTASITVNPGTTICEGETVTLTAQGSAPFNWSTGANTQTIMVDPTVSTNYAVTIGSGCGLGMANQQITVVPNPTANAGSNTTICSGSSATLSAAAGGSSYNWSSGQSGRTISVTPTATRTYMVTVTSGPGCEDIDQVTVFVEDPPNVNASGNTSVCEGESVILTATGASSYSWSNSMSGSSITFIPTSSGTFTVTGTSNGCDATDQVSVTVTPKPSANVTGNNAICEGEMTSLSGSGSGSYSWSTGSSGNSIDVSPASTTTYSLTVTNNGCSDIATYQVTAAAAPVADAGIDETICSGDPLTLTASGGTSYEWSNGEEEQSIDLNPTASITYSVTVSNGMCSDIDEVTVSVFPLPSADISGDLTICEGATIRLDAVGSGTYNWSTNTSSAFIEVAPSITTNYTLTITNNGCSQTATKTVVVTPSPTVNAGSDVTVCEDGTVTLNATGANSYMWSTGETGPSIMVSPTSDQTISVTGILTGCSAIDEVDISVQSKNPVDAGADQKICIGSEAMLSATGGVTYEWSEGSKSPDIIVNPTITTIYFVTATDGVCTDIDEIEIEVRDPFLVATTPDTTACRDVTIQLVADAPDGVTYNWSTQEDTPNISISPTAPTTYIVTLSDGICDITREIRVNIDDINVNLESDGSEICLGTSVDIEAISTGTILWSDGSSERVRAFVPTNDTTILVQSISTLGCKAEDQINISVNPLPNISIDGQPYYCVGNTTDISVSDGLSSYAWSDGSSIQQRTIDLSGTYSVIGTDDKGCESEASIVIAQNELPTPMIIGSRSYCPSSSTTLSIDQTYAAQQWSFNGDENITSTISIGNNGTVMLQVTDDFGCIGTIDAAIESNPDLTPVISGGQTLCENTMGQLDAGNGFDNYEWSTGEFSSRIDISAADTYSVTVSTDDGCSGMASIDVSVVPNPQVAISGDLAFCANLSTTLSIPQFPNIQWSTGASIESINVDSPGAIRVDITDSNGCIASHQVMITENSKPNPIINGDLSFCENGSTALNIEGSYSSVTWSNGERGGSIMVDAPGSYSITVEDTNGCTNDTQVNVIENANPAPQIIAPSLICEKTETKIYTSEQYVAYAWNSGIQADTQTIFSGGSFEVIVTDNNGCLGRGTVSINESETPFIDFKKEMTFCNTEIDNRDEPLAINLDTAFISKNVNGFWSTNASNLDLSNLSIVSFDGVNPGMYEFTYTSTNASMPCEDISRTVMVEVLNCQCPNVQFQSLDPLCSLSDMLDLSTIQSSNFEGSWQIVEAPSTDLPSINGDIFSAMDREPGVYRLEFRLEDGIAPLGCAESKSVNVEILDYVDAAIELVKPACGANAATFKLNLTGGGPNYDVNILQANGQMIRLEDVQDGHTFDLALNGSTVLSLNDVISSSQACGFQASEVNYTFEPSQLDAQINLVQSYGDFDVSCATSADGSASVEIQSGTAPYEYTWSNGATTSIIDGLSSGTYSVSVQDAIGCEFISAINITAPPEKQIALEPQNPSCGQGPGRLLLSTIPGISASQWELYIDGVLRSETQIPTIFNDIEPGSHILEAVNSKGCMESHSFTIMDDSAFAIEIDDITISLGQSAILTPYFNFDYESILWSPSIYLSDPSSQSVVVQQPLNSTLYNVAIRDLDGCVFKEIVRVNVDKERKLSMPTGFTPNGDGNNDTFIIHAKSDVLVINTLSVFDRWGEEVFNGENIIPNQPIEWDWTFRNQGLQQGQYIWIANVTFIDNEDINFNGKFYILR